MLSRNMLERKVQSSRALKLRTRIHNSIRNLRRAIPALNNPLTFYKASRTITSAARTERRQRGICNYYFCLEPVNLNFHSQNVYLKLLVKLYRFLARRMEFSRSLFHVETDIDHRHRQRLQQGCLASTVHVTHQP